MSVFLRMFHKFIQESRWQFNLHHALVKVYLEIWVRKYTAFILSGYFVSLL